MATPVSALRSAVLRTSPHYEMVPFDKLTAEQLEPLGDLQERADVAGVLRPCQGKHRNLKAISHEAAALYAALIQPAQLPGAIGSALDEEGAVAIAKLVLDGVLEIESVTLGRFVSGAEAYPLLYGLATPCVAESVTARLSISALRYAQALDFTDPTQLSMRMYLYNRQPAAARWRRLLRSTEAVTAYLDIQPGGAAAQLLKSFWQPVSRTEDGSGWLAWYAPQPAVPGNPNSVTYKLYVSAPCEEMPRVFAQALGALVEHRPAYLKVGSDLYGLLRPDKMVVYFDSFADLQASGAALRKALAGTPAQGVPFTSAYDESGLLCWGMDPPRSSQWLHWQPRESWRLWVTNRLAAYMVAASSSSAGGLEPWQFALERMRLDGVDVATWTPQTSIWDGDIG